MVARNCKHFFKDFDFSSILSLPGSIFFKSTSPLDNLNKFSKSSKLFSYLTYALNAFFIFLSIAKYIKKNLQHIFKTLLKVQILIPTFILLLKSARKPFLKLVS